MCYGCNLKFKYKVRLGNFLIWNARHLAKFIPRRVGWQSFERSVSKRLYHVSLVTIMQWMMEERAFAVESYFSSRCSIITTQRTFRNHFRIAPVGHVSDQKLILLWVDAFRKTGNVQIKKTGASRTIRTPENIEQVRQSILRSPRRSVRKHAAALGMSDRFVRRILEEMDIGDVWFQQDGTLA